MDLSCPDGLMDEIIDYGIAKLEIDDQSNELYLEKESRCALDIEATPFKDAFYEKCAGKNSCRFVFMGTTDVKGLSKNCKKSQINKTYDYYFSYTCNLKNVGFVGQL